MLKSYNTKVYQDVANRTGESLLSRLIWMVNLERQDLDDDVRAYKNVEPAKIARLVDSMHLGASKKLTYVDAVNFAVEQNRQKELAENTRLRDYIGKVNDKTAVLTPYVLQYFSEAYNTPMKSFEDLVDFKDEVLFDGIFSPSEVNYLDKFIRRLVKKRNLTGVKRIVVDSGYSQDVVNHALLLAVEIAGNVDIVRYLLTVGADANTYSYYAFKKTVEKARSKRSLEVLKLLLEKYDDILPSRYFFNDFVRVAATNDNLPMVKMLLEKLEELGYELTQKNINQLVSTSLRSYPYTVLKMFLPLSDDEELIQKAEEQLFKYDSTTSV